MTNFKRITALLIAWALVLSAVLVGVPAVAAAEKSTVKHGAQTWINPLYEGRIDLSEEWTELPRYAADPNGEYVSEESAAKVFRQALTNRDAEIRICVSSTRDGSEVIEYLLEQAVAHTGVGYEGDYIYYHLGGYSCKYSYSRPSKPGDPVNYTITYQVRYLSTPEEEIAFKDAAATLLASLGLETKTDFEKIRIIHDYISANISYDYSNDDDTTKYTAYGALVEKKAVCQGYANLFYYLTLLSRVDTRIISGMGGGGAHAWNIVKLNGLYYNLDATWDSSGWGYTWFLCGQNDFPDHIRDVQFETAEFHKKYPMAMTKYDSSNPETPDVPQETEPAPTEPKPTEPKPTEPKPTEPKPTEPKPTEPKPTEPKPTEPKPTEPKPTEPKPTEPKPTEPKPTEPKPTEPKPTEPVPTDPACQHQWQEATCKAPKTCKLCGEKTGKVAPHTYDDNVDGTCNVCSVKRENVEIRQVVHMFRMYNPNTGEHFYTGSTVERDNLIEAGWKYEGVGFTFPANTGAPVYRLFQPSTGEHLYTMDKAEKEKLEAEGWNYEGIAFNSAYNTEAVQHRLHNPNATVGAYHFTFSLEEKQNLINAGWEYQGIGWYSCWK